ncbi:MAG: hypothetical protein ACR2RV_28270 [Verrucomicrobiales bacterium]
MSKRGGESAAHRGLKRAALVWAQQQGFSACAYEVRVPKSNYRADVAAYRPAGEQGHGDLGVTAIFECKQSRPDFLSDARPIEETLARLEDCRHRMGELERLLGVHHPNLRRGETLFPEFDSHEFDGLQHDGYQKLVAEVSMLESRLYGKTKFDKMVKWRCANALYAVVGPGVMSEREVPRSWGLLRSDDPLDPGCPLELLSQPKFLDVDEGQRLDLLQRLARAGTSALNREEGVDHESLWEARRRVVR